MPPLDSPKLIERIEAFRSKVGKPLIVIAGPTGTGKTALSIGVAKHCNGEVVNADSRQIYRGMEIGAAVATEAEQQGIPHHLLSFLDPPEVFTLADYQRAAFSTIDSILERGRLPLLVGGTGLYINAVCLNYSIPNVPPDPVLRARLEKSLKTEGFEVLREELARNDPTTAAKLQSGQDRYLLRALEIANHGGIKSVMASQGSPRYDCLFIFLQTDREKLRARLIHRVKQQLEAGVLDEVRILLAKGYDESTHSMNGISCKEWIPYLRGKATLEGCSEESIRNNLRYAKRQATWFRGLRNKVPAERLIVIDV